MLLKSILFTMLLAVSAVQAGFHCPVPMAGLCVIGNKIYDSDGYEIKLVGLNRPSMEWMPGGSYLNSADYDAVTALGGNIVRIPLHQGYWRLDTNNYRNKVREIVEAYRARGMRTILDLHRTDKNGMVTPPPNNQNMALTDLGSVTFWSQVATEFKNDTSVVFEIFNEPHYIDSWDIWLNGGMYNDAEVGEYQLVGMQEIYNTVRATGANNLVLISGLNFAYSLVGLPQYAVQGFNIAYTTHLYDYTGKMPQDWQKAWQFATTSYPVMVTEFGDGTSQNNPGLSYSSQAISAGLQTAGFTAWGWWWFTKNNMVILPTGSKDPSVVPWQLTPYGELVRDSLQSIGARYSIVDNRIKAPDNYFDSPTRIHQNAKKIALPSNTKQYYNLLGRHLRSPL